MSVRKPPDNSPGGINPDPAQPFRLMANGNGETVFAQRYSTIIQTITVVALFVGGFWAGVISPIQSELHLISNERLTIREHEEFKKRIDDRIVAGEDSLRRAMERMDQQINKLQADIVPRAENIQHWNETNERGTNLRDQINEINKTFSSTYNIGDQIKQLQKQVDDLRNHPVLPAPQLSFPSLPYRQDPK